MKKGNTVIITLIVAALIGVNALAWYAYFQNQRAKAPPSQEIPEISPSPLSPVTVSSPTPAAAQQSGEEALVSAVKETVSRDTATAESDLLVTVGQNTGTHAKGNVRERETVGGGYFLAAKTAGSWVVVYHGQSQPECGSVNRYDFPTAMVPECVNTSGNIVPR